MLSPDQWSFLMDSPEASAVNSMVVQVERLTKELTIGTRIGRLWGMAMSSSWLEGMCPPTP